MLKILLSLLLLGVSTSYGQNKVKWGLDFDYNRNVLQLKGEIEEGWHLYSSMTPPEAGPIPVEIKTKKSKGFKIKKGFVEKYDAVKTFDANFDSDVFIFEENYLAEQQIKLKKNSLVNLTVTFMICNHERCLPPIDEELSIKLNTDD
ncbi:protein-disulfide reductase DsbD N-terminal domain-containing protein [Crocinitomicaceae bacterium]|nr:protein-disulfide reductase DsbD N-terminal domain-containing protein [Crocinitomicaceae bacterium]